MFDSLTEKQREVLAMVADNRTSKEMARVLGISESAVVQRVESIRKQADGAPRAELARMWRGYIAANTDPNPTYNSLTGQSSGIPVPAVLGDSSPVGRPPGGFATTSVPVSGSHLPSTDRSSIVPAAHCEPQGTRKKIALGLAMAAAVLVIVLSILSIADNLPAIHRSHGPAPTQRHIKAGTPLPR